VEPSSPPIAPQLPDQAEFWDQWTARHRAGSFRLPEVNARQARAVERWITRLGRSNLDILEVGCGSGWLCERLAPFGTVTGTDLSALAIEEARRRCPGLRFEAGDFAEMDLPPGAFDAVVTLEVLAHVPDAADFLAKIAGLLRPGGYLMLATQNRPVLERWSGVPAQGAGQIRRWVDRRELRRLVERHFEVVELSSVHPVGDRGLLRWLNADALLESLRPLRLRWPYLRMLELLMLGHTLLVLGRKR